ncbi:hypothetical protein SAMN04487835_1144 [Sharpea azabuensis]|uniref:hypothetical protein n=1 Tax=Sharpea azabuensis TaxID=322505 RepID=UPI0008EDB54C|nr:hypothetical protein [Sharpea azabuensis]SFD91556.1 hypothetical protein SAMN04487836_1144 [Sharpea azabuensis]SFK86317.1 hypothetical protein SAMN04487835_1144 [Sharpea azabuensis]
MSFIWRKKKIKRSENRKALPKFLLTLLIPAVIGGCIGMLIGQLDRKTIMKIFVKSAYNSFIIK